MKFILASNSPRRKEILSQIGLKYKVVPSCFKEIPIDINYEGLAMYYAESKAMDVARMIKEEAFVIGADTIVYLDKIMGKPKNAEDAYYMLSNLSGAFHSVITGISIVKTPSLTIKTEYEKTRVKFKDITKEEIEAYIKTGEPMGKAGGYAIQGKGSLLVERINGCYFNVVGLPVYRLSNMLKSLNYDLFRG